MQFNAGIENMRGGCREKEVNVIPGN